MYVLTFIDVFSTSFNAGRLDRSLALNTEDYLRLAEPRVLPIVAVGLALI